MGQTDLDIRPDRMAESPEAVDSAVTANFDLGALIRLLLGERVLLLKGIAVGALLFAVIGLIIPAKYESVAQLMPPNQSESAANMLLGAVADRAQDLVGLPGNLFGGKTSGALFVSILTSQTVEDDLVRQFDLRRVYWTRYWETARKKLEDNTTIAEDRKSGVIVIRVRDKSRDRAQEMCRAYVAELNRLSIQLNTSAARREREFLEQRLAVVKKQLDESARNLAQFSSANSTMDISAQAKAELETVAALQGRLIAAESQLGGLKQIYSDQNVRVLSLERNISELRRNLRLLTGQNSQPEGDSDLPYPSLRNLPLVGVRYSDLLRRAKVDEAVYEILTKQYELARIEEAKDTPTVRLLDPPSFPERHISPRRTVLTALGALFGCIVVGVFVVWRTIRPENPHKKFILDAYDTLRDDIRKLKRNRRVEEGFRE
jgi:uncharacterized protein involved in exopolysaccharide biosynthesis